MNVTKLKLKIKEVKEEWKPLCVGMRCIIHVAENCPWAVDDGGETEIILKDSGYVTGSIRYKDNSHCEGLFHTETIRDATPKEIIAWHTLQSLYVCSHDMPIQLCKQCANNLGPDGCYIVRTRGRAEGILKGKEVILSVTEESI